MSRTTIRVDRMKRRIGRTGAGALLCLSALLVAGPMAPKVAACPNCKLMLAEDQAPDSAGQASTSPGGLAEGFYWSILLMMAAPFGLVAGFGGVLLFTLRARPVIPTTHADRTTGRNPEIP
jgi:hypothetical protein